MNSSPPYEIGPEDVTADMLRANVAPTYDQLSALIGEGKVIRVHDPRFFDQDQVEKSADLDRKALVLMSKLKAPDLMYHRDIVDVFDRVWKHALKGDGEQFKAALLKDDPDFDFSNEDKLAVIARTSASSSVMLNAMSKTHLFSAHFISLRMKHGVDPGVQSAVTAVPDIKADGTVTMSLISIHGIENDLGDERLYIDLYRPN